MVVNTILSRVPDIYARFPRVSIVGVGDEGNDIISRIFEEGGSGAQCIAVNTVPGPLEAAYCHQKVLIPVDAAPESRDDPRFQEAAVQKCASLMTPLLAGADVTFVIAKMREEETAEIASSVANVAKLSGAVTLGVAIMLLPFQTNDRLLTYRGLARMRESCHTLAIIDIGGTVQSLGYPQNMDGDSTHQIAVGMVSGLAQTLACPSVVNIDPLAFRELMTHGGIAHVGIGCSSSPLRAEEATIAALRGPLLYDNIARTRGVLLNVRGGASLTVEEAERAGEIVVQRVGWDAPIVMGAHTEESWAQQFQVSVLLTGGTYPYMPGGYRRLPLEMYEMEPDGEEGPIDIDLDLDQIEQA